MIVTIAAVVSADGKLTRHDEANIYQWTSPEDWQYFTSLIQDNEVIIMGRKTYDAIKGWLKPSLKKRRVVLTRDPKKHKADKHDGLEFTDEIPRQLMQRLSSEGITKVLVTGGSQIHADMLASGLVDYIHMTIEPYIFGQGRPFTPLPTNISLRLTEHKKLNNTGTLLLIYKVLKVRT